MRGYSGVVCLRGGIWHHDRSHLEGSCQKYAFRFLYLPGLHCLVFAGALDHFEMGSLLEEDAHLLQIIERSLSSCLMSSSFHLCSKQLVFALLTEDSGRGYPPMEVRVLELSYRLVVYLISVHSLWPYLELLSTAFLVQVMLSIIVMV